MLALCSYNSLNTLGHGIYTNPSNASGRCVCLSSDGFRQQILDAFRELKKPSATQCMYHICMCDGWYVNPKRFTSKFHGKMLRITRTRCISCLCVLGHHSPGTRPSITQAKPQDFSALLGSGSACGLVQGTRARSVHALRSVTKQPRGSGPGIIRQDGHVSTGQSTRPTR